MGLTADRKKTFVTIFIANQLHFSDMYELQISNKFNEFSVFFHSNMRLKQSVSTVEMVKRRTRLYSKKNESKPNVYAPTERSGAHCFDIG